jgi:hypothetical protein
VTAADAAILTERVRQALADYAAADRALAWHLRELVALATELGRAELAELLEAERDLERAHRALAVVEADPALREEGALAPADPVASVLALLEAGELDAARDALAEAGLAAGLDRREALATLRGAARKTGLAWRGER